MVVFYLVGVFTMFMMLLVSNLKMILAWPKRVEVWLAVVLLSLTSWCGLVYALIMFIIYFFKGHGRDN